MLFNSKLFVFQYLITNIFFIEKIHNDKSKNTIKIFLEISLVYHNSKVEYLFPSFHTLDKCFLLICYNQ